MTRVNLNEFLSEAYRRQRQGDFRAAETMYRQVLAQFPDQPDTLNLLATLGMQLHRPSDALPLIQRAIALRPDTCAFHCNLATALRMLNRFDEALSAARRAVELGPGEPNAYLALALAFAGANDFE